MPHKLPKNAVYLVGGAVRDELLGRPVIERDWCVVGLTPQDLEQVGFMRVGKDFPVYLHPDTHEEYALARTERKSGQGHQGFECSSSPDVTLEEDLLRRDLTINAMAEACDGTLVDPYNGQQDLQNQVLRHVSPAFREDPLRVLRVARFSAQLATWEFTVAEETLELMKAIVKSGELQQLSEERIWRETFKALCSPEPQRYFKILQQVGALDQLYADADKLSLHLLQVATSRTEDPVIRICTAAYRAEHFLTSCKAPKAYRELAQLCYQHLEAALSAGTPQAYLDLMMKVDAIRRPDRFSLWLTCCEIVAAHQDRTFSAVHWQTLHQIAATADLSTITQSNLIGKAIAEAIYQHRLQAIRKAF